MDIMNLPVIVTLISLFLSLFLAFFLLTVRTTQKSSNVLFAIFLILIAIDNSQPLFGLIINGPSNFGMFRNTFAFLQIPVFYLYVLSVCYSDFRLKPKYFLHLLPFVVVNIVLLPRFYTVDFASKVDFIMNRQDRFELQFNHILFHILTVVYLTAVFILLKRVKKIYLENYAATNINSYQWLFQFTTVLAVVYFIVLFKNIFKFSDYPHVSEWIKIELQVFLLFVICWYLFKALSHPNLFRNVDSKLKLVKDIISEDKNSFPEATIKAHNEDLIRLENYMANEKPFLNPALTIQDISNQIQIPVRELSVLINHQLGQHFYDFVNKYRIENAMEILKDSSKSKVTVLEILYEVGFNSKSSFNTAFKKHTGNTPTDYRKTLKNSVL